MSALVARRAGQRVLEELELGLASDERSPRPDRSRPSVQRIHEPPGTERRAEPSELEWAGILDHEVRGREPVRRRAEQDLARCRRLLEPRRHVHRLAGDERRVRRLVDHELTGFDADPRLEPELVHRGTHRKRCPGGALGVVLVRLRDAERREHGIAGELLDDAAVQRDAVRDRVEELRHATAHHLGIRCRSRCRSSSRCR